MSSIRQVDANKRNAALSTGPKSEQGKRISRANAITNGLSGQGIALADSDAAKVEQRLPAWRETFAPGNEQDEWLVRDLVVQSVRLENCRVYEAVILDTEAENANASWDDDRTLEAAKLLGRLAKQPEVVSRALTSTKQGCQLVIDEWRTLARAIEERGAWTDLERARALDLSGVPLSLRDAPSRFECRGEVGRQGHILAVVQIEIGLLTHRLTSYLTSQDEQARTLAASGVAPFASASWRKLDRHERACRRRLEWTWAQLKARSSGSGGRSSGGDEREIDLKLLARKESLVKSDRECVEAMTKLVAQVNAESEKSPPTPAAAPAAPPLRVALVDPVGPLGDRASGPEDWAYASAASELCSTIADGGSRRERRAEKARGRHGRK
jgi:hypothetical protein